MMDVVNDFDPVGPILAEILHSKGRGAQADLARALDVTPQTVTKWVNGSVPLPVWRWLDVELALELPTLHFARATGYDKVLSDGLFDVVEALDDDLGRRDWWVRAFGPRAGGPPSLTGPATRVDDNTAAQLTQLRAEVAELREALEGLQDVFLERLQAAERRFADAVGLDLDEPTDLEPPAVAGD